MHLFSGFFRQKVDFGDQFLDRDLTQLFLLDCATDGDRAPRRHQSFTGRLGVEQL